MAKKITKKAALELLRSQGVINNYDYSLKREFIENVESTKFTRTMMYRTGWCVNHFHEASKSYAASFFNSQNNATAWASHKFSVREWVQTPFGTWMDKKFVESRNLELGINQEGEQYESIASTT